MIATALLAGPVQALTIINDDVTGYEVSVVEGQDEENASVFVLYPGDVRLKACTNGCTVQINDGDEMKLKGNEKVSIKDGDVVVTE